MSSQLTPNDPGNPYAAPKSRIDDLQTGTIGELAPRSLRFGAAMIDAMLFMVPVFIAFGIGGFMYGSRGAAPPAFAGPTFAALGLYFLVIAVVDLVLVARFQQTIGKRICKIRVVRSNGDPCSPWRIILLRGLVPGFIGRIPFVGPIFSLVDPLLIFREDYRCVHDHLADTTVVRA